MVSGLVEHITEVLEAHRWAWTTELHCRCGWFAQPVNGGTSRDAHDAHVAAAIQDVLEIWVPPIFASAIHAYADSELLALPGCGDDPSAEEVLQQMNNQAAEIAVYALTSNKWRGEKL